MAIVGMAVAWTSAHFDLSDSDASTSLAVALRASPSGARPVAYPATSRGNLVLPLVQAAGHVRVRFGCVIGAV